MIAEPSDLNQKSILLSQDGTGEVSQLSDAIALCKQRDWRGIKVRGLVKCPLHVMFSQSGSGEYDAVVTYGEKPDGLSRLDFGIMSTEDARKPDSETGYNGALTFMSRWNIVRDLVLENTKYAVWMEYGKVALRNVEIRNTFKDAVFAKDATSEGEIESKDVLIWKVNNWLENGQPYRGGAHGEYFAGGGKRQERIRIENTLVACSSGGGVHLKVPSQGEEMWQPKLINNMFLGQSGMMLYGNIRGWFAQGNVVFMAYDQQEMINMLENHMPYEGRALILHGAKQGTTSANIFCVGYANGVAVIIQNGSDPMQVAGDEWYVLDQTKCDWGSLAQGLVAPKLWKDPANPLHAQALLDGSFARFNAIPDLSAVKALQSREGLVAFVKTLNSLLGREPIGPSWFKQELGGGTPPIPPPVMDERWVSGSSSCTNCRGTSPQDAPPHFATIEIPDPCKIYVRQGTRIDDDLWLEEGQTVTISGWPGQIGMAELTGDIYTDYEGRVVVADGVFWSGKFRPVTDPAPPEPPEPEDPGLAAEVKAIRLSIEEIVVLLREVYNR